VIQVNVRADRLLALLPHLRGHRVLATSGSQFRFLEPTLADAYVDDDQLVVVLDWALLFDDADRYRRHRLSLTGDPRPPVIAFYLRDDHADQVLDHLDRVRA